MTKRRVNTFSIRPAAARHYRSTAAELATLFTEGPYRLEGNGRTDDEKNNRRPV